jgi:hypothetical protein
VEASELALTTYKQYASSSATERDAEAEEAIEAEQEVNTVCVACESVELCQSAHHH